MKYGLNLSMIPVMKRSQASTANKMRVPNPIVTRPKLEFDQLLN